MESVTLEWKNAYGCETRKQASEVHVAMQQDREELLQWNVFGDPEKQIEVWWRGVWIQIVYKPVVQLQLQCEYNLYSLQL